MNKPIRDPLLAESALEVDRLILQAQVWEPEAEEMLAQIGVQPGWQCADLGCGPLGILGPLSRRVGPDGHVVGIDLDPNQLAAAFDYIEANHLDRIELLEKDAYRTGLRPNTFDLTHVRFLFAPLGRNDELLQEMLRITRPGGVVAIQEHDASSWHIFPANSSWTRLKETILEAYDLGGGDFNAGQRTFQMLRLAGLRDVHARAAVLALQGQHPYKRLPVQFAALLRKRILDGNLLSEDELDRLVADCERIASDPDSLMISFVVTQVWGTKP
jgi:SAM-dependent methyltransferase